MFKTRRKRAVVLALIAFFCATACVSVDWQRFGGGILAFFKGRGGPVVASTGGHAAGSNGAHVGDGQTSHHDGGSLPVLAIATSRKHAADNGAGKTEEDLFKYGNPAAGGIPPGSFIVAQNDTPAAINHGDGGAIAPAGAPIAPEIPGSPAPGGGQGAGGGVTSSAPAPAGGNGDGSLPVGGAGTPPAPAPGTTSPPAPATPAPAPTPTQSGTTDPDGGDSATPAPAPLPSVSAIPEASSLQMMTLGALFLAVAAARRRKTR